MKHILIEDEGYYLYDDIINEYPSFKIGCDTRADIIKKHKLDNIALDHPSYIYIKEVRGVRIITNGTYKRAKLFIAMEWLDVTYYDQISLAGVQDTTQDAPPIIKLEKNEKIQDDENNILQIEVVGTRDVDGCYFKVDDVSKGFDLPRLQDVILDKGSRYEETVHYKYFYSGTKNNKRYKKLFLTYKGFFQVISSSRNLRCNRISQNTIYLWLLNFCNPGKNIFNNRIHKINNKINDAINRGFVYCAYSIILNSIKIGYWRSSLELLMKRYITYYGDTLQLEYVETFCPNKLEKLTHNHFQHRNLSNELFDKKYLDEYIQFINDNKITHFNGYNLEDKIDYELMNHDILVKNDADADVDADVDSPVDKIGHSYNSKINLSSCLYFSTIGTVADMNTMVDIPEPICADSIVCTYGTSEDISKIIEHNIEEYEIVAQLIVFKLVDENIISEVQIAINDYLKNIGIVLKNGLVVINESQLKNVKSQYSLIIDIITKNNERHALILKNIRDKYDSKIFQQKMDIAKLTAKIQNQN